jgi:hypothetical protein
MTRRVPDLISLYLLAGIGCTTSAQPADSPRVQTDVALFLRTNAESLAKLPVACGKAESMPRAVILVSAEQCLSCMALARAMRESVRDAAGVPLQVLTRKPDAARVCAHLRREGLGNIPVSALSESQWTAPWPPRLLWVALLDEDGTPEVLRVAPQASSSLLR